MPKRSNTSTSFWLPFLLFLLLLLPSLYLPHQRVQFQAAILLFSFMCFSFLSFSWSIGQTDCICLCLAVSCLLPRLR